MNSPLQQTNLANPKLIGMTKFHFIGFLGIQVMKTIILVFLRELSNRWKLNTAFTFKWLKGEINLTFHLLYFSLMKVQNLFESISKLTFHLKVQIKCQKTEIVLYRYLLLLSVNNYTTEHCLFNYLFIENWVFFRLNYPNNY